MPYDYSSFHRRILALEEATAEWHPRARKTAKNLIVDDHYLHADNMENHDTLTALYEGLYEYVRTRGSKSIPLELEITLWELGAQPRWKIAQGLFQDASNTPHSQYARIWQQYIVLTDRFAHQVDFHLSAPQLMAIWEHLGVKVSYSTQSLIPPLAQPDFPGHKPLSKLAKKSSLQLVWECEQAVLLGKEEVEPIPHEPGVQL